MFSGDICLSIHFSFPFIIFFVSVMARHIFPDPDARMSLCASQSLQPISYDELIKIPAPKSRKALCILRYALFEDAFRINRICHRSSVQTEKSQGKRVMPETGFTKFLALSVNPRLGFLGLHWRPMIDYFS